MLARRFLWIIAAVIVLVVGAALAYRLFGARLIAAALVPSVRFADSRVAPPPDYALPTAWAANPVLATDPARWAPPGYAAAPHPRVAVFFITPTADLGRDHWNMAVGDTAVEPRIAGSLRSDASVFNGIGAVWAPKYRQAVFGASLVASPDATKALDLAYGDVQRAFDAFVAAAPKEAPIVLAGHGQGALHLLRLLHDRVAGQPIAQRIVAVYAVGTPVSVADLPALGVEPCTTPEATHCLLTWQSFAEPADIAASRAVFDATPGLTARSRKGTRVVCVNPLLGVATAKMAAPAANIGSLVPGATPEAATIVAGGIGARCLPSGIVSIGDPPGALDKYVLPGNDYQVYDYNLFWANIRADFERRVDAFIPG
ncbi:DUF3089 domain-containing protein [Polymorphobacter sp. PAMC 29334]|uniref:DUF3089 domain-containing protein n=1 Tax=Polymorphobacter sp. PAMC 29334 TaxID=2862331 RepID=UPI001C67B01A|nr:DUF3089 domain-containing protein [Polymorphobacter sp. PAMC 29334]QYE34396.1 DUF3089 domain-containing protein [Polymorphobacter sp. PAMC 29334]